MNVLWEAVSLTEEESVGREPDSLDARQNWLRGDYREDTSGTLWVKMPRTNGDHWYAFPATFEQFLAWKRTGFSENYFLSNWIIDHSGNWGWPWGRTEGSGWWEGNTVIPKGEPAEK